MATMERPIARASVDAPLHERLTEIIRTEIADGRIARAERLFETRLAERFGTSRAPVRQALRRLHEEGVLRPAGGASRGFVVASVEVASENVGEPTAYDLVQVPAWQQIYGDVQEALTSRIPFGSWRVVEGALGQHYGVSRTVAREVLARLQSRGLVVNEGKGWIAPELSSRRVGELYDMRALLEPAALTAAAPRIDAERLREMQSALDAALSAAADSETLDRLEEDLHVDVLSKGTNRTLWTAVVQHQSLLLAHRFLYRWTSHLFQVEPFLQEHLKVVDALSSGRAGEAAHFLRDHLLSSKDRAIDRIVCLRDRADVSSISYLVRVHGSSRS